MNCAIIKVSHVFLHNKTKMLVVEGIPSLLSPSQGLFSTVYVSTGMSNATVAAAQVPVLEEGGRLLLWSWWQVMEA